MNALDHNPDYLLEVRDLSVSVDARDTRHAIIKGVSLSLMRGETLGIVGESGAGKSVFGSAVAGMLERPIRKVGGEVYLENRRIDHLDGEEMRRLRGASIGMVFQDPLTSLDPLFSIGDQLIETIRTHRNISKDEARARALELLKATGIPAVEQRIDDFPHQFSGGMRQRVVLALALCVDPKLIIADEPTTALDVSVQAQIIRLLGRLCRDHGTSIILITHDMGVIAEACDNVAVMYSGRVVEYGPTQDIIHNPRHPYTRGLMASIPPLSERPERLQQIDGAMPGVGLDAPGCAFRPRCPVAFDRCSAETPVLFGDKRRLSACWLEEQGQ